MGDPVFKVIPCSLGWLAWSRQRREQVSQPWQINIRASCHLIHNWQYYSVYVCMRCTFRSDGLNCWCGSALFSFMACVSLVSCLASTFCKLQQYSDKVYWFLPHQPQLCFVSFPTARNNDAPYHTGCVASRPYSHENIPECYAAERGFRIINSMQGVTGVRNRVWHLFWRCSHCSGMESCEFIVIPVFFR